MTQLSHNFEGGPGDGVAMVAGSGQNTDTAGNNYFDSIQQAASGTSGYSSTQFHSGAMACRFQCAGTAGQNCVRWHEGRRGSLVDDYFRAYFYLSNSFTVSSVFIQWITSALASQGTIIWQTDNKLLIRDDAGGIPSGGGPSTTALALNTWHRIEVLYHADTTSAVITLRIFAGANAEGTSPTETLTTAAFNLSQGVTDRILFGLPASNANQPTSPGYLYVDDVVDGAATWVGPTGIPAKSGTGLIGP